MTPAEFAYNHIASFRAVSVSDAHGMVAASLVVGELLLLVGEDALEADGSEGAGLEIGGGSVVRIGRMGVRLGCLDRLWECRIPGRAGAARAGRSGFSARRLGAR